MARAMNMPLSEWDALSDDDRDWALATDRITTCPVCGGDDPADLCQNSDLQYAWVVTTRQCYRQRAVLMAMEKFKDSPYASTIVPHVELDMTQAISRR